MNDLRKAIFDIVQPSAGGNVASTVFDFAITFLVLLSIVCVFVSTFDLPAPWGDFLQAVETVASIAFTVEYLMRLFTADFLYKGERLSKLRAAARYARSGMAIVDLVAILPFYLPMVFPCNLLVLRIFRLMRLLRVFKLNRYFESLAAIGQVIRSKARELVGSIFFVALMLVISSLIIYSVEHDAQPGAFKNAFSGLWWAVATLTTVGYGDIYPITVLGRVFGAVIAILGIGMVAIPTGIISSGLVEQMTKRNQKDKENEKHTGFTFCPYCGRKITDEEERGVCEH